MAEKHTPGPWFADRKPWQNPGMVAHLGSDGVDDWCVSSMTRVSDEELGPNTHLAAAAPDLLSACEWLLELMRDSYRGVGWIVPAYTADKVADRLQAAVATAKGVGSCLKTRSNSKPN